jgi:hypothetical protein
MLAVCGCEDEQAISDSGYKVDLKFEVGDIAAGLTQIVEVKGARVIDGRLVSDNLIEVSAVNRDGARITAYLYATREENSLGRRNVAYTIEKCYVFTGECFEYGTLITGSNGGQVFIPASLETKLMGYGDQCPPPDGAFV